MSAVLGGAGGLKGAVDFAINAVDGLTTATKALYAGGLTPILSIFKEINYQLKEFGILSKEIDPNAGPGLAQRSAGAVAGIGAAGAGLAAFGGLNFGADSVTGGGLFGNSFRGARDANKAAAAGGFRGKFFSRANLAGGGEAAIDAAAGAGVGIATFNLLAAVVGRTADAMDKLNKALAGGSKSVN